MRLEVVTPDENVGEITGYLQPRRAVIHHMLPIVGGKRISCEVPLAEMFGFGKSLPKLSGYQELPADVAAKIFGYL